MGAVQIPRVVAALIAALAGVATAAPAFANGEPVAVIDARAATAARAVSRAALATALGGRAGLAVLADERAAALAAQADDADAALAASALAEAQTNYGALDCGRARPAAEDAVTLLAARAAAGLDEATRLGTAWTYVMLCADRDGDPSMARLAADRLRALGGGAAVPAETWARYPDIDAATDRDIVELTVAVAAGAPAGAVVTIDHVAVGPAPVTRFVAAGKHVVAVAAGPARGARYVTVLGKPVTIEVPLVDRTGPWRDVAARVAAWQGATPPTAGEVTELMARVDVRVAMIIADDDGVTVWARPPRSPAARVAFVGALAQPRALGDAALAEVAAWSGGPTPGQPLLTERDVTRRGAASREPTRWWVYAVIGGALAAGAVTMYALDAGEDRQMIDLTF